MNLHNAPAIKRKLRRAYRHRAEFETLERRHLLTADGLLTFDSFAPESGPTAATLFSVDPSIGKSSVACLPIEGACGLMGNDLDWSADGSRGLFVGPTGGIFIVDFDGSHLRPVKTTTGNSVIGLTPAWVSGTGAISYAGIVGSTYDILMAPVTYFESHVEIGTPVNLTNHPNNDFGPTWKSDGSLFAFNSDRGGAGDIFVMGTGVGAVATNITADRPTCFDARPDWQPGGNKIVFVSNCASSDIWTMDADGGNQVNWTNDNADDDFPVWSPDGTKIAFTSSRQGSDGTQDPEIYVMSATGGGQHAVTENTNFDWNPSWRAQAVADIDLDIRDAVDPVAKGELAEYTLRVHNSGPLRASGVSLQFEPLDPSISYNTIINPSNCMIGDDRRVSCTFPDLEAGTTATATLKLQMNQTGLFTLTGTAAAYEFDDNLPSNTTFEKTTVKNPTDVAVTVAQSLDILTTYDTLTYTLNVTNNGDTTAFGVEVKDTLPAAAFLVSAPSYCHETSGVVTCYFDTLDPGKQFTIKLVVASNLEVFLTNDVTVTVQDSVDTNPDNNTASIVAIVGPIQDSDGDGLYDPWELRGMDMNRDGVTDLDLPKMGAHVDHKDLYVEVDYMTCAAGGCGTGKLTNFAPAKWSLLDVGLAFLHAPVDNPDGHQGIKLHAIQDEKLPVSWDFSFTYRQPGAADDFQDLKMGSNANGLKGKSCGTRSFDGHFGTAKDRESPNCENILLAKSFVYRYAIFGATFVDMENRTGIADTPGSDLLITARTDDESVMVLGASKDISEARRAVESGTFMHELGHSLGLKHGGGDHSNYKPNYLSVMNYDFQTPQLDPTRPLDYSRVKLPTLDENHLNEVDGILGLDGRKTFYRIPLIDGDTVSIYRVGPVSDGPIDWDLISPTNNPDVSADINADLQFTPLEGYDDWSHLLMAVGPRGPAAGGEEISLEELLAGAGQVDFDGDGVKNSADNCSANANADQADTDGNGIGDVCQGPDKVDLQIDLLGIPSLADDGPILTVNFLVTNFGNAVATNVTITVPPIADATYLRFDAGSGVTCTETAGVVACTGFETLAAGASLGGQWVYRPLRTGDFSPQAIVGLAETDVDPTDNSQTQDSSVTRDAFGLGWQYEPNPRDVDADGTIAPIDALIIINELNAPTIIASNGKLPPPPEAGANRFYDVDGNGFAVPLDALFVINFLNGTTGEGETTFYGAIETDTHVVGKATVSCDLPYEHRDNIDGNAATFESAPNLSPRITNSQSRDLPCIAASTRTDLAEHRSKFRSRDRRHTLVDQVFRDL